MGKGLCWTLLFLILILILLIIVSAIMFLSTDKILPNVYINEIEVSNLTKEEAMQKLEESYGCSTQDTLLALIYDYKIWNLKNSDIDIVYNYIEAIDEAYNIGKRGNIINRYIDSLTTRFTKNNIYLKISYNEEKLMNIVDDIANEIDREPVDATIEIKSGEIVLTDDILGLTLQRDKTVEIIKKRIEDYDKSNIELPIEIKEPAVKKAEFENIKDKLGEYTTRFNASNISRTFNISLAAKTVTGIIIKPGEIFSLNKIIGSELEKKGYKMAKVIINNEYVEGIGGGLCQISTTLYNAALLSNLKIVERKNHSIPSDYVGLGRDATLSGDYIDMKFENNSNYPVYIYGEVKGNRLTFSIFGKNENPSRNVEIRTSVVRRIEPEIKIIEDDTLPVGTEVIEKEARTGYVVKSYRAILENGKEVFVEPLYTDTYRVSDEVKRIGTKPEDIDYTEEGLNREESIES